MTPTGDHSLARVACHCGALVNVLWGGECAKCYRESAFSPVREAAAKPRTTRNTPRQGSH